jgi:hypothetical protein
LREELGLPGVRNSTVVGRVAAVAAVAIAVIVVAVILLSGGMSYQVRLVFQNASQIVNGDEVQLNPILGWLSDHQQLMSDFISNGATGIAATTTSFSGNGVGHYLRQFSPVGSETLSFAANRDSNNRGNTYPGPPWLANPEVLTKGNFPSWDCKNTGAGGDGSVSASGSQEACWVAPPLPGAKAGQIPHLLSATYPDK